MALAGAFASAARRYWLEVYPVARREIHGLRKRAEKIPNPVLRRLALDTYDGKWASLEGAAAFATFAPPGRRTEVAQFLIRFQAIYEYADTLMEQPSKQAQVNARQLHMAILTALQPSCPHVDYYAHNAHREDGGYLRDLVDTCRATVRELPAYPVVCKAALDQAERIVFYQSHINLATESDHPGFARWAEMETAPGTDLRWWEVGAASGSSLALLALLTAAADPRTTRRQVVAIEAIYWPWVGALHTLLDCLVDRMEDEATGQHNLLDHYISPQEMAVRMSLLASEAVRLAKAEGIEHSLLVAGMASLYLSDKRAWLPDAYATTERVLATIGDLAIPAMLILRARRFARRLRL